MTIHAGCRELAVFDPVQQARVATWLLYPTTEPARTERFGPFTLDVARDARLAGEGPLVVISHGTGGTPWGYRGLATSLAHAGMVVAMVEHPGNCRADNSLADEDVNLTNRPRHVRLAIDAALADAELGPRLRGVAAIGHSIGAYTVLAAAGGHAMTLPKHVVGARRANPDAETAKLAYAIETEHDPRLRAVVLLAPALGWFMAPGALADVTVPILVRSGARDELCPTAITSRVLAGVPDRARVDHVDVPGAGHFAFVSPYPPEMTRPDFIPSQDPPGFDRAAYQPVLHAEIAAFLRASL